MENNQDSKLLELQKKQKQAKIKKMIKYSYQLKKIGLVDSLRQNIASELTNEEELNKEILDITSILRFYLEERQGEEFNKGFEDYLQTLFTDYQEYRNNILNINLLDALED